MPAYTRLFSRQDLLNAVNQSFPDITSMTLSRVMKFSFPDASKVVNKQGYFFANIVPRPSLQLLENKRLIMAAKMIQYGDGQDEMCNLEMAAALAGFYTGNLASILYWLFVLGVDVEGNRSEDNGNATNTTECNIRPAKELYRSMIAKHAVMMKVERGVDLEGDEGSDEEWDVPCRNKGRKRPGTRGKNSKKVKYIMYIIL